MKKTPTYLASLTFASLLMMQGASTSLGSSARPDPDKFFEPGPVTPEDLPDNMLYPNGTLFLYSFFSIGGGTEERTNDLFPEEVVQEEFKRYAEYGIPFFGPQYELSERSIQDAEDHGLKVLYTLEIPFDFHAPGGRQIEVDPDEVFEELSRQIKEVVDREEVVLWYLKPEELRPWRPNEMAYLEIASRAVRESDPQGRPLYHYDPNHASHRRLRNIAPHVDYVGKGMYVNYAGRKNQRIWAKWTIEEQNKAIEMTESDAVSIAVPEMFRQPEDDELDLIPTWVRHDVYLALASGAKGVIVFSARRRPNFPAREAYYEAYLQVGQELVGEDGLGQVFLFGEERDDMVIDIMDGPKEVELIYPSGGVEEPISYPSVNYANLAFGDDRYLFLINSALEPVTVAVGGMPFAAVQAESLFEPTIDFEVAEGEFMVELEPLQTRAYRLTRR